MKPGGSNRKFNVEVYLNPPEGISETFKAPEIKNGLHFDFSNFFKLETCKNLYKIILVKLIAMIDLIFWLELHYKKATLQKTALFSKICKKRCLQHISNIFRHYLRAL